MRDRFTMMMMGRKAIIRVTEITLLLTVLNAVSGAAATNDNLIISPGQLFSDIVTDFTVALARNGRQVNNNSTAPGIERQYEDQIKNTVSQMYNMNDTNTNQILTLVTQTICTLYGKGMLELFQEMKRNQQEPDVLLFSQFLKKFDCETTVNFNETISQITINTDKEKVLDIWASAIQAGSYYHIYDLAKYGGVNENGTANWSYRDIVEKSFNGTEHSLKQTLRFVKHSPFLEDQVQGYQALIQKLMLLERNHSEEMLLVSYWIHDTMFHNKEEIGRDKVLMPMYENLKAEIPSSIGDIYWKSACTIKNLFHNEYIYACAATSRNAGHRKVLSWVHGQRKAGDEWVLKPVIDKDNQVYFKIRNKNQTDENGYLTETLQASEGQYKHVSAANIDTPSDKHHMWVFQPTTWNVDNLAMKILNGADYPNRTNILQSTTEFEGLSRRVGDSSRISDSSYWEVKCF